MDKKPCDNCKSYEAYFFTSFGSFCSTPCIHEFLGWVDCKNCSEGHAAIYPYCEICQEIAEQGKA